MKVLLGVLIYKWEKGKENGHPFGRTCTYCITGIYRGMEKKMQTKVWGLGFSSSGLERVRARASCCTMHQTRPPSLVHCAAAGARAPSLFWFPFFLTSSKLIGVHRHMSCSLNSLKGVILGYIGEYYRGH